MTTSAIRLERTVRTRTSTRARACIGGLIGGYVLIALVAAVPNSPLATPLPAGATAPAWAVRAARWVGLEDVGRLALIVVSLLLMAGLLAAFGILLWEAWRGRVGLGAVLAGTGVALAVSVAAPVLLSRDVFSYAAYGRVDALHHADPYVLSPAAFRGDPFVAVTAAQWLRTHSPYGPLFTILSSRIVRIWHGSPSDVIVAFKALAGMGIALGTVCAALAARRVRPERAALAAAIVGLNPVVVVHTVGGGHVDAMVAAPLGAALLLAVFRPPPVRASRLPSVAVTVLLTAAVLIKPVTVPALALWVWWVVASAPPGRRAPTAAFHVAVVAGLTAAALVPFVHGLRTLTPLASLGGVEAWASPSHLVGHGVEAVVGWLASSGAGRIARLAVEGAFLGLFVAVCWRMGRRWTASGPPHRAASPADAWGPAFLLLALAMPFLLPWYAAWFVPFLALLRDEVLLWIGVAVTGLLATTLIPADPFRGYTTWAVMAWVHYVVAPLMLLLLLVAARRVLRDSPIRLATMERAVLVYDADCGFCRWSVAKILRWDRRGSLRAVAAQDPEADALLGGMDAERKMASWHLVTPDGRVYSAGAAVRPLWEMLPGGKPVALLARLLPGTTERAYAWVADHRDQLGRRLGEQACSVDPGRQRAS